jgi:hypothetical protein
MEEWRNVVGFEGLYQISNKGRVKRVPHTVMRNDNKPYTFTEMILNPHTARGYKQAILTRDKKKYSVMVHRMVAQAFIDNPQGKPQVNHIDGNKQNNDVSNLEWVTASENVRHAFSTNLRKPIAGNSKLTEDDVRYIKNLHSNRAGRKWGRNALAKKLNVSTSTIDFVLQGKTWTDVR